MKIRLSVMGVAAMMCVAADNAALPASLNPAFANTIVSTYPDGRQAKLWLNADGGYAGEGRRHGRSTGHWTIRGQRICLRQSRPPTLPIAYCTAIPSGGVGTTWLAKAVTGEPITVRLVAGR